MIHMLLLENDAQVWAKVLQLWRRRALQRLTRPHILTNSFDVCLFCNSMTFLTLYPVHSNSSYFSKGILSEELITILSLLNFFLLQEFSRVSSIYHCWLQFCFFSDYVSNLSRWFSVSLQPLNAGRPSYPASTFNQNILFHHLSS